MARRQTRKASSAPSRAESGTFGWPTGARVTLTAASYVPAEDMGRDALKGGRAAADPMLRLDGEIDGIDDLQPEYFGCGKAARLTASEDGSCLEIPEGSTASGLHQSTNAYYFLASLVDKKKQGKLAVQESLFENDIRNLVGLTFVIGKVVPQRDFAGTDAEERTPRPVTVAEEIVALPNGAGPGKRKAAKEEEEEEQPRKKRPVRDEEEAEEVKPAKKRARDEEEEEEEAGDVDVEEEIEKVIAQLLESPKFRKGIESDQAFNHIFTAVRTHPAKREIMAFCKDEKVFEKWLGATKRPWTVDENDKIRQIPY